MQQHPEGAQRPEANLRRVRRTTSQAARINRRSIRAARALQARFQGRAAISARSLGAALVAALRPFTTAERALPVAVAAIVALASLLALLPNTPQGAVGGTQGSGTGLRIAVGGGAEPMDSVDTFDSTDIVDAPGGLYSARFTDTGTELAGGLDSADVSFAPVTIPEDVMTRAGAAVSTAEPAAILADGTLQTGYAPSTAVEDGSDLITIYRVKSGDTLVTIARKFKLSMMTIWWANKLKAKDELHVGQRLRIPSVNGVVVKTTAADTLESLAAKYDVTEAKIIDLNQLDDPTLVVGQVLVLPNAHGAAIPTPKPTPKPAARSAVRPRVTASRPTSRAADPPATPVAGSAGRSSAATTTSASISTTATGPSTSRPTTGPRSSPRRAAG